MSLRTLPGSLLVLALVAGCGSEPVTTPSSPATDSAAQAAAAGAAGAAGAIIYNNTEGALNGTLGGTLEGSAPTAGVTQAEGQGGEKFSHGHVSLL